MIITSTILRRSLENYKKAKQENFTMGETVAAAASASMATFILAVAIIFFIFELILLYFAIYIALKCSTSRSERIVNFVLATTFTLPYMLLNNLFNPCSQKILKNM